ncbi:hypothetical protein ACLB1T_18350 [Escherichia coli]
MPAPGDRNDDVSAEQLAQRHLAGHPLTARSWRLAGHDGTLDDADDFGRRPGTNVTGRNKRFCRSLQQQRNSLSDKHLRPLDIVRLRLNMDYATALDVMFAGR